MVKHNFLDEQNNVFGHFKRECRKEMVSWRGNGTQMQQWEWQGHNNMRHCSQRNRGFYQASDGYRGF